jgi:hypothetical protein
MDYIFYFFLSLNIFIVFALIYYIIVKAFENKNNLNTLVLNSIGGIISVFILYFPSMSYFTKLKEFMCIYNVKLENNISFDVLQSIFIESVIVILLVFFMFLFMSYTIQFCNKKFISKYIKCLISLFIVIIFSCVLSILSGQLFKYSLNNLHCKYSASFNEVEFQNQLFKERMIPERKPIKKDNKANKLNKENDTIINKVIDKNINNKENIDENKDDKKQYDNKINIPQMPLNFNKQVTE